MSVILDSYDFIIGKKYLGKVAEPYRAEPDLLLKASTIFNISPTAQRNLEILDSAKEFYKAEPDIAKRIQVKKREECFYGMKLEYVSPVIPARALYFLLKCYKDYNTVNYFPKVLSKPLVKLMFSEGYIAEGYTLKDVICTITTPNYQPLSAAFPAVNMGDYSEIYIKETDAIALVPNDIRDKLNYTDIENLTVKGKDICCGNTPIRLIGSHYGATHSTYDLRDML